VKNAGAISWSELDSGEAALIERWRGPGTKQAVRNWSRRISDVFTLALHLLGDRDEALDLSQEVFLRVFQRSRLPRTVGPSHLDLSHRRQSGPKPASAGGGVVTGPSRSPSTNTSACSATRWRRNPTVLPDRLLASKEAAARVWQALDRLPFDQKTALILREVDGLRYEEIAFSLGVAVGTVKSRLTRARQALRSELLGLRT
jgi:RNA polymerase sigma-70 factor (ECF subfamily)